ncbi:unnamed protein product [Hymenolepis diminuta]|nr:unnamed protein product [Hymenolepis diminuta]
MDPADLTYEKINSKLDSVVGDNSSLFNLTISEDENVHHHGDVVNRLCTSFRFGSLDETQFRCFIFILEQETRCQVVPSQTRICWGLLTASFQLEWT